MSRTPAKRFSFLQIPTNTYNEHKVNLALAQWFSYISNPCMTVSCPRATGFFKARAWGGDILLKLYIEWKIFHINVNSYTIIACYDCIAFYRLCGRLLSPSAFVCLPTCLTQAIWWTTLVWCAWFPGSYSWSRRAHSSATACFFRNTGTTSINFPVSGLFTANPNPPADCGLGGLPIASAWEIAE